VVTGRGTLGCPTRDVKRPVVTGALAYCAAGMVNVEP
jgi:hypothetical protein